MANFVIFIKTAGDHLKGLPLEKQKKHIENVGGYLGQLMQQGKLKEAQPLEMDGVVIHKKEGAFMESVFENSNEQIVGYFHVIAPDIAGAVEIAKQNPIWNETNGSIEIRPIKQLEGIN
ncbi:YciI family protein [Flagellimonas meishanensis]|uniref:YciI family protein n=1 Tax=Flagellimonas meishanensis TaxID=2873264 RepID=UPI001CA727F6|nr:YciI family protein [[Muricauda] meishanensis]